jgi:hypothetical protein
MAAKQVLVPKNVLRPSVLIQPVAVRSQPAPLSVFKSVDQTRKAAE